MIFTKKSLQEYIVSEAKKILAKEKSLQNETLTSLNSELINEEFEIVADNTNINPKKIQELNEELKRMKHLVDFRSPLLRKE